MSGREILNELHCVQVPASSRLLLSVRSAAGVGCAMGFGMLSASRAKCLGGLGCTWMVLCSVLRQGTPCSGAVYDYGICLWRV